MRNCFLFMMDEGKMCCLKRRVLQSVSEMRDLGDVEKRRKAPSIYMPCSRTRGTPLWMFFVFEQLHCVFLPALCFAFSLILVL